MGILLLFLALLSVAQGQSSSSNSSCLKISCVAPGSQAFCSKSDQPLLSLDTGVCKSDQVCYVNKRYDGVCVKKTSNVQPIYVYPGQPCIKNDPNRICAFGPKACGDDGVCAGFNINQACVRTADCNYGLYCQRGFCSPILGVGAECTSNDACGRLAYCYYSSIDAATGYCVAYFSFDDGDQIGVNVGGTFVVQAGAEKLCRSQSVNVNGTCTKGLKSTRKGLNCTTDTDCKTTDSNSFASCKCGFTTGGNRYCDLHGDDEEWGSAHTAFLNYFINTKDCHVGAGWTECGRPDLYKAWKCAELKAQYFVELKDNPPCLQDMYAYYGFFRDYVNFCMSGRLLYISIAVLALITSLLV